MDKRRAEGECVCVCVGVGVLCSRQGRRVVQLCCHFEVRPSCAAALGSLFAASSAVWGSERAP